MADLPLVFHPEARIDALEAHDWYFQRSPYAADAFRCELREAGLAIQRSPDRWAEYASGTRRYLMKRFPFVVVYRIFGEQIQVVAVAHGRQKPGYWKARIASS